MLPWALAQGSAPDPRQAAVSARARLAVGAPAVEWAGWSAVSLARAARVVMAEAWGGLDLRYPTRCAPWNIAELFLYRGKQG